MRRIGSLLIITGEAAIELGKRDGLIKKVVNWCEVEEHPGVQGEANRLIAWLINNSRSIRFNKYIFVKFTYLIHKVYIYYMYV